MFGFASGRDMQVALVAQNAWGLHRIVRILLRKLLQKIIGALIDQVALLDPAFETARGAHAGEALLVLQYLHTLAILHVAHAVEDSGYLIAQRRLRRGNVIDFEHAMMAAIATGDSKRKQRDGGQREGQPEPVRVSVRV